LYVGAAGPLTQPTWVKTLPRFYGTDGKVGVDYRTLSQAVPRPAPIQGQDRFFKLLDQSSTGSPNILCVLGPWTDIAKELREADKERRPSYLKNVSAVITVAGAFALDHDGKSIGNEGPERQAEYNVFLDPDALIEGVTYFNREKIPVYDISWSFQGRWRLWRPLLETLKPKNPDDGAAWAAILLANGFYTFHGGNTVTAGGGVGQRAWMTADAHALLFAETLCTRLQTGPLKENEKQVSHHNSAFKLTPTAFIVISNDKVPAQYGRTIRVEDLALAGFKDSTESRRLNVVEVNLDGSEQDALATFLRGMRLEIDETKWNDINRQLSTPHPASPTK
ncbi:MAG: nucleoside hydrolase, partial [Planctomycetota bacterium]